MQEEIIISGFGGQGTLLAGRIVAQAAMDLGHYVTWIPSYGPEMRGGKARCTVTIADHPIGSPLVRRPSALIALNLPSMDAFEPLLKPNGLLIVNESLIPHKSERQDIQAVYLPASDLAKQMGDVRMANMICLGGLITYLDILPIEAIEQAMHVQFPERHQHLLETNIQALHQGIELASS